MHMLLKLTEDIGKTATPEAVQFYILAPLAIVAAIGMLVVKKAVHSAILMAFVMLSLAFF